ncbi:MAG: hypothetical protein A2036_00070 [Omnitrophica bacterium GWA2_50_21]|nr:MAG: hypothetical protein A2036_00070 [Omnitrophica bacterium GWA2_50_21]
MLEKLLSQLTPRGKVLLAVAVACVVMMLMDRIFLGPILDQIKHLEADIEVKKETVKRYRRILSFKSSILEEYSKYSGYLDSGEKTREEIISALLKKIETLAKQQSVTVSNIKPGDVEKSLLYDEYKTGIECEGTLTNMLAFMNFLEQSDYLFQIIKYEVVPKSKGAEIVKCSMDVQRTLIEAEKIPGMPLPGDQFGPDNRPRPEQKTEGEAMPENSPFQQKKKNRPEMPEMAEKPAEE